MESKSIQSMGGEARAKSLSEAQRIEIASRAAAERWKIPMATHEGPLILNQIEIPCFVLETGTRVISQRGLQKSLGMSMGGPSKAGAHRIEEFLTKSLGNSLEINELVARIKSPITFQPPHGGRSAFGYEATILADICDAVIEARKNKRLSSDFQIRIADQCELLMRGFAKIGIIALVDEATGYQEVRDRRALQKILELYITKELLPWTRRFPDDFYKEMFRLKNWKYPEIGTNKPQVVGHYTNDIVYNRLVPGVLEELKRLNPPDERGNRAHRHHQWLTPDIGHPKLRDHISGVIALMKSVDSGVDSWGKFLKILEKVFPKRRLDEFDFQG